MALFVVIGEDRPGGLDDRMAARPDHLAHWRALGDRLVLAGPFLNGRSEPCGSLLIIEAEDEAEAKRLAGADPYVRTGVFDTVTVRPWTWSINAPEGR